jgi:methionyl-tRNA synthetase
MRVFNGAAWPYASGPRHLGHVAGVYLPADVLARYHRLAGDDVLFVSGTDQHGTPVILAAERAGVPPEVFAERQHERIARSFAALNVSFDRYTKTGTPLHSTIAQRVFVKLFEHGFITSSFSKSAFCPAHDRSLPDRYVEGTCPHCGARDARGDQCDACGSTLEPEELLDPRCSRCGTSAEFRDLRQLFLRLDLLADGVRTHLESSSSAWPPFAAREALKWLDVGLRPRAVTRDLRYGVQVPLAGWDDRRLYVWFDAVIGYLSASIEWAEVTGDPGAWEAWWLDHGARHRYVIGKDNVWFHAIWWPAILLGSWPELHLPDRLDASHHLTLGSHKFSSSRSLGTTLDEALESLDVDVLRHALCALRPETGDTELSWDHVEDVTRTGLLGSIANPCHRVTTLLSRRFGGTVDEATWRRFAVPAAEQAQRSLDAVGADLRDGRIRSAVAGMHQLGRSINQVLATREPWKADDDEALRTLSGLIPLVDAVGVAAAPFVPETSTRVLRSLGRPRASAWTVAQQPPQVPARSEPPLDIRALSGMPDTSR